MRACHLFTLLSFMLIHYEHSDFHLLFTHRAPPLAGLRRCWSLAGGGVCLDNPYSQFVKLREKVLGDKRRDMVDKLQKNIEKTDIIITRLLKLVQGFERVPIIRFQEVYLYAPCGAHTAAPDLIVCGLFR